MKRILALMVLGILLLGCAQEGGTAGGTAGSATTTPTGGSGGQIVSVGGTTGGGSAPATATSGGSSGGIVTIEQPEPGPEDVVVYIRNFQFVPRDITVKQGRTVFWYNEDDTPHSVRSIGVFDSPYIAKDGGPYWHTFSEDPGRYEYSCGIHGTPAGTITVVR